MVTQLKETKARGKRTPPLLHKPNGKNHDTGARRTLRSKSADSTIVEPLVHFSPERVSVAASEQSGVGLIARGKDLLSGEAGSVATAAAIVVGAALIEVELIPGLIIGAGAILLGKLFPELSGYVRPMVKSAVRAGFSMSQKAREVMAEASEQVHDLVAEVKHEQELPAPSAQHNRASGKVPVVSGVPVH